MSVKKIKIEKVMSGVTEYLKKRNYESNACSSSNGTINEQQTGVIDLLNPSMPNAFSFSTTSATDSLIDQQYLRLKAWITEASEPCRSELSQVLFPLFIHLYLELFSSSGKKVANNFFNKHHHVFLVNHDYEIILQQLIYATGDMGSSSVIQSLKNGKYVVKFSELTLNYFKRYLKSNNSPTLLQIFNTYIEVEVDDSGGAFNTIKPPDGSVVSSYGSSLSNGHLSDFSTLDQSDVLNMDCSEVDLLNVKDVIDRVRMSDPIAPSLCVYNVSNAYNGVSAAKINSDARLLACGFEDSVIKLWKLTQPIQNKTIFHKYIRKNELNKADKPQTILACDHSRVEEDPNSENKAEDEDSSKNGLRRHTSGGEMLTLRGHCGPIYDMAFNHTSSHLFSVGEDTSMRLWNLKDGEPVCIYTGHHYPISCLDVSSKTLYIASGSFDNTARLWTSECLYSIRTFVGHKKSVDCVAFHPNCSYLATGSSDKSVRLWQINDGAVARIFLHHQTPVNTLAFSPNGKYLASGSEGGNVVIWDLDGGKVLCELGQDPSDSPPLTPCTPLHTDPIVSLCWSKDSSLITSASSDGCIRTSFLTNSRCGSLNYKLQEIGLVNCNNNSNSLSSSTLGGTLLHCSLTSKNYLAAVSVLDVER